MVERGSYGVVRIVSGPCWDRLAYYDDDDFDEDDRPRAIVYLGVPFASQQLELTYRSLRPATPDEKVQFELEYLSQVEPEVRERLGLSPSG